MFGFHREQILKPYGLTVGNAGGRCSCAASGWACSCRSWPRSPWTRSCRSRQATAYHRSLKFQSYDDFIWNQRRSWFWRKLSLLYHYIWMRDDLLLVFIGWREGRQRLLQLSKSFSILSCQTQLVASQKLTQLVLFHQPYHLESQTSKKIQCQNMIWKPL